MASVSFDSGVRGTLTHVVAEKTDRLYRNFKDYVVLEDLDVEIHPCRKKGTSSARSPAHMIA